MSSLRLDHQDVNDHAQYVPKFKCQQISDIVYDEQTQQKLDLFIPSLVSPLIDASVVEVFEKRRNTLIVFIHGGTWALRDKADYAYIGHLLSASYGFCLAIINYRLLPSSQIPHYTDDCYNALCYLASQAPEYPYAQDQIFLMGHSCGALISAVLALDTANYNPSIIKGVIGSQGIYDLPNLDPDFPSYVSRFIDIASKGGFNQIASPTRIAGYDHSANTSQFPRFLIMHSSTDSLVNLSQPNSFINALQLQGITVASDSAPRGDHFATLHHMRHLAEASSLIAPSPRSTTVSSPAKGKATLEAIIRWIENKNNQIDINTNSDCKLIATTTRSSASTTLARHRLTHHNKGSLRC